LYSQTTNPVVAETADRTEFNTLTNHYVTSMTILSSVRRNINKNGQKTTTVANSFYLSSLRLSVRDGEGDFSLPDF